tara:strand:+ start:745 stop:1104 length:360 start_codon:yes stop_codon:yes gene_type:complete
MKKSISISLFILFTIQSCSTTIHRPLYSKSENAKELILSKFGKPSEVESHILKEIWRYQYNSEFKSNRTIIFNNNGKIITNQKHYKTFHMVTFLNKHGYIAIGTILLLYSITGPFPALL